MKLTKKQKRNLKHFTYVTSRVKRGDILVNTNISEGIVELVIGFIPNSIANLKASVLGGSVYSIFDTSEFVGKEYLKFKKVLKLGTEEEEK